MADKRNVIIDFLVKDQKAKTAMKGLGQEAGKAQGRFSQLSGGAKALVGGFAAIAATKIVGFLGDAATAAAEDAKQQALLKLALQNTTDASDAQVDSVEDWIEKTAMQTGIADDELRPAMAELSRAFGDVEKAQETLGVAMDIATAKGLPLETVTKAIGKAAGGAVGPLGRLGIKIKDAEGNTLSLDEALAEANRTMGGATATAADTAAGKMQILRVRMDEAKESIGTAVIPILADLAEQGSDALQVMDFLGQKMGDMIPEAEGVGTSLKEWLGPLGVSRKLFDLIADEIDEMTSEAEENNAVVKTSTDRYDKMTDAVDDNTAALQNNADELRAQLDPMFNLTDKANDLTEAQLASTEARDKYGDGSPEHLEALRNEAGAWLAFKEAQSKAAAESGITREQYEKNLKAMGLFTQSEIDAMVKDFDRVNNYHFNEKTIRVRWAGDRRGDVGPGMVGHSGGVIPGPRGQEVPILAQAGETLIPLNGKMPAGTGNTYNIGPIHASGTQQGQLAGRAIVEAIRDYEKRNGSAWRR